MSKYRTLIHAIQSLEEDKLLSYLTRREAEAKKKRSLVTNYDKATTEAIHDNECPYSSHIQNDDILARVHGRYGRTSLMLAIALRKSESIIMKLIDIGGQTLIWMTEQGMTSLHHACIHGASTKVVSRLIDMGGKSFLLKKSLTVNNVLFYTLHNTKYCENISKIIAVGGKDLVLMQYVCGNTALHYCIHIGYGIEVIESLLECGDKELVMMTNRSDNLSALHIACMKKCPVQTFSKLIEVGKKDLVLIQDLDGNTALHYAIINECDFDVISLLLEYGGKDLVIMTANEETALHLACRKKCPVQTISKLIEVGGKDLVLIQGNENKTALHVVTSTYYSECSFDVVSLLIECGGKKIVLKTDDEKKTALHLACKQNCAFVKIESKLIHVGGKYLVAKRDYKGKTALHYACERKETLPTIMHLLHVGGNELVMIQDKSNETALTPAIETHPEFCTIASKMIALGGKELVLLQGSNGFTALHYLLMKNNDSRKETLFSRLINVGGSELLLMKDLHGDTAMYKHFFYTIENDIHYNITRTLSSWFSEIRSDTDDLVYLIKLLHYGILYRTGGELSIGGLFVNADRNMHQLFYNRHWERCLPAIQIVMNNMIDQDVYPPILHAAIINHAPKCIIEDIIEHFPFAITVRDESLNSLPIETIRLNSIDMKWNSGLKEIIEATAAAQNRSILHVASHYGLCWVDHMNELVKEYSMDELCFSQDEATGLSTVMLAATSECYDLNTIYELVKLTFAPHAEFPRKIDLDI